MLVRNIFLVFVKGSRVRVLTREISGVCISEDLVYNTVIIVGNIVKKKRERSGNLFNEVIRFFDIKG